MSDTASRVKRIIAHAADLPESDVQDVDGALVELLPDALGHVELMISLEEEFDLEISDDQAEALSTVGDVVAFVEARR